MEKFKSLILCVLLSAAVGCQDNGGDSPEPIPEGEHTVIVYMIADNNLSSYAVNNINDMEAAYNPDLGAKMLVFYNQRNGAGNEILEISQDNTTTITSEVLKEYATDLNPCSASTVTQVIEDCMELAPANHYSLIFWSHGSGWLPKGMSPAYVSEELQGVENGECGVSQAVVSASQVPSPQNSFGISYTYTSDVLELCDLAAAIPEDVGFEFIYFDACHMGSIEVAYELKDKANYLIASPAEILAAGYPYSLAMDEFLTYDSKAIAEIYYDYYNSQSGVYQSATVSVTDLSKMENVAAKFKAMTEPATAPYAVQQYGRYLGSSSDYRDLMWDVSDMAKRTYGEDAAAEFLAALDEAVVYKAATPYLFYGDSYGTIVISEYSGLSLYIPKLDEYVTLEIYMKDYKWAQDTEFYKSAY